MAEGFNRVMLLGNLGADPELRFTQGGQAVLNLRLATTETYLDKDKVRRERTDWHSVVVWGKRGEALAKILGKGSSIFVEGSLRTSSYDDRDGNKRYKTEVIANNVILAGSRGRGTPAGDDMGGAPDFGPPPAARGGDYGGGEFGGSGGGRGGGGRGGGSARGDGTGYGGGGSGRGDGTGYGGGRGSGGGGGRASAPAAEPEAPADDYGYDGGGDDIPF